ncbi:MAG: amidohydrolase family protein [Caldilineaceae bacterium]
MQTGGHTYWCCREASGADEMRRAVLEQVRAGADLIKIMACHDTLEFTDEELAAVIDETHRNGLTITAHATYDACINRVAQFGVDCVEHGGSMTDETIQLLLDKKIPIVTTFAPLVMQSVAEVSAKYMIPEWKIEERQKAVADPRYQGLINAAAAGVVIGFGTDAGSPVVGHDVIAPRWPSWSNSASKRTTTTPSAAPPVSPPASTVSQANSAPSKPANWPTSSSSTATRSKTSTTSAR